MLLEWITSVRVPYDYQHSECTVMSVAFAHVVLCKRSGRPAISSYTAVVLMGGR